MGRSRGSLRPRPRAAHQHPHLADGRRRAGGHRPRPAARAALTLTRTGAAEGRRVAGRRPRRPEPVRRRSPRAHRPGGIRGQSLGRSGPQRRARPSLEHGVPPTLAPAEPACARPRRHRGRRRAAHEAAGAPNQSLTRARRFLSHPLGPWTAMNRTVVEAKPTSGVDYCSRNQEGVVTLDQAWVAGMTERQTRLKVERGEWGRPYRGVFIDNSAPVTPMQPVVAAFFAVGGLASHRLGLWLWTLVSTRVPAALDFTVPYARSSRVTGVVVHRVMTMPPPFYKGVVAVT